MTEPQEMFRSQFQLPSHAQNPSCSIELLGFVTVEASPFQPLQATYRQETLIIGEAPLKIENSNVPWTCFFRPTFDSWRPSPRLAIAIVFFCPVPENVDCNQLREMDSSHKLVGNLSMTTHNTTWVATFETKAVVKINHRASRKKKENGGLGKVSLSQPTACLAITYETSNERKREVNGAMVFEWVRYYATLGFNVMLYDKNGEHQSSIFTDAYGLSQNQQGNRDWLKRVDYHPYTIFGLLTGEKSNLKYDNTNVNHQDMIFLDDDKTATLTHCRFEASALHGSDNVLVADFDEFLYCPSAKVNFASQFSYMNLLMTSYRTEQVDELIFLQIWVAANLNKGKYSTLMDCLIDHVNHTSSIINCFGGFNHNNGMFFVGKSISLGHKCPMTNFHNSCHSSTCLCTSAYAGAHSLMKCIPQNERCYFIHLSTNPQEYSKYPVSNETLLYMENNDSELQQMLNAKDDTIHFFNHENGA